MINLSSLAGFLKGIVPHRQSISVSRGDAQQTGSILQPFGFNDFLELDVPPRGMLLHPILPERSLAMLYAPRGVGKTLLSLSTLRFCMASAALARSIPVVLGGARIFC